jgi:hypothetical protein
VGRFARFVEMRSKLLWMGSHLLPAMNVHSPFAELAMSMKEEREIKHVLSAKPGTNASKGVPELMAMKKKRNLMIWIMSLNMGATILNTLQRQGSLPALVLVAVTNAMLLGSPPPMRWSPLP